jgi:hypothetical protein
MRNPCLGDGPFISQDKLHLLEKAQIFHEHWIRKSGFDTDLSFLKTSRLAIKNIYRYTQRMKISLLTVIIGVFLTACSPKTPENGQAVIQAPNLTLVPAETASLPTDVASEDFSSGSLVTRIFSPLDATVNSGTYLFTGQANHEVVVTVNDAIFTSPSDTMFTLPVELEDGPNLIEVVISDLEGNEITVTITITYNRKVTKKTPVQKESK